MLTNKTQRILAATLSASLLLSVSAGAANSTVDEAYYVNLDYYGRVKTGNIVKSYSLNGDKTITDYGTYDSIKNMTNYVTPTQSDGKVEFTFDEDVPERFYFEGKTEQPLNDLPWTVKVTYKLNGVPTDADKLAGAEGLIEMGLDLIPNSNAKEYYRNNMVLTAVAAVDADKTLSLEAEGAMTQAVGNMKTVIFMALPGEEKHFVLRVGSNDFEFGGWVLMMVPATLDQLSDIADLREDKKTVEDSANAISDSLDVILNTTSSLSGGLSSAASGLDALDDARQSISDGKGKVYEDADISLEDLKKLTEGLEPFDSHLSNASSALSSLNTDLNTINSTLKELKPTLEQMQKVAKYTANDMDELDEILNDVDKTRIMFKISLNGLASTLDDASSKFDKIQKSINPSDLDMLMQADSANATVLGVQKEILTAVKALLKTTTPILDDTRTLTTSMNNFLNDIDDDYNNSVSGLLSDMKSGAISLESALETTNKIIDNIDKLNTTMNDHHDGLVQSIADTQSLIKTIQGGTTNLHTFLTDSESLLKTSGGKLDAGTKATLASLSDVLRKSAHGFGQSGVMKNAKNTVKGLIDDKWDEHTGEETNVLLMDANAPIQSLTASENPTPSSLQILMRTEEITVPDDDKTADVDENFHAKGNVLSRIGSIFQSIWDAVTGIFQ